MNVGLKERSMKRRQFITLVGGTAVTWPLAARAQQAGGIKRGAILDRNPENPPTRDRVAAFQQGLRDAGWQEDRNISFEVRWGAADAARIDDYAAGLGKLNPDGS